jgi:hypothetical protein
MPCALVVKRLASSKGNKQLFCAVNSIDIGCNHSKEHERERKAVSLLKNVLPREGILHKTRSREQSVTPGFLLP